MQTYCAARTVASGQSHSRHTIERCTSNADTHISSDSMDIWIHQSPGYFCSSNYSCRCRTTSGVCRYAWLTEVCTSCSAHSVNIFWGFFSGSLSVPERYFSLHVSYIRGNERRSNREHETKTQVHANEEYVLEIQSGLIIVLLYLIGPIS